MKPINIPQYFIIFISNCIPLIRLYDCFYNIILQIQYA